MFYLVFCRFIQHRWDGIESVISRIKGDFGFTLMSDEDANVLRLEKSISALKPGSEEPNCHE